MFGLTSILTNAGIDLVSKFIDTGKDKAIEIIKERTSVDLSKEPSNEDLIKLKEFEKNNRDFLLKQIELMNQDRDSARKMSVELSKSDSWLVKNTGSILALFVTLSTFTLFGLLLNGNLTIDNPNVALISGFVGGYVTTILSFYFGSSKTEADSKRLKK